MRFVQAPKIGGDHIFVGGHRYQNRHILRELVAFFLSLV